MSIVSQITNVLTPVHREGHVFIAIGAAATLVGFLIWSPLGWLFALATLVVAYFFRDPERVSPQTEGLVIAPADGKVIFIENVPPPPELELGEEPLACISIFLTMLDVHVNRSPVTGRVLHTVHRPGVFHPANEPEAKSENERRGFVLETRSGVRVGVVQIAGFVARRTVKFVDAGDMIVAGERFGLIRFGSRVDLYLPLSAAIIIAEGQRMVAGETVVADLNSDEPRRVVRRS
jgi:phosphatidylserine decarboxylase